MEQKNTQLETILEVVDIHMQTGQIGSIFGAIDDKFDGMELFNCPLFKDMLEDSKHKILCPEEEENNKKAPKQKKGKGAGKKNK